MKSTFSTIFYLKRQAARKDGTVPVMGRITVDGTQTQFSCKITITQRYGIQKVVVQSDEVQPQLKQTVCLTICV